MYSAAYYVLLTNGLVACPALLRLAAGVPLVLFFPGYVLLAAFIPRWEEMSWLERTVLSFGLNVVLVPFLIYPLNFSSWGIRFFPVFSLLTAFLLLGGAIALYRRRLPADGESGLLPLLHQPLSPSLRLSRPNRVGWVTLGVLLVLLVVSGLILVPAARLPYTEFFLTGMSGNAADYPRTLAAGETGKVQLWVASHEIMATEYQLFTEINGLRHPVGEPFVLKPGERKVQPVEFTFNAPPGRTRVEFELGKGATSAPVQKLHLWIEVPAPAGITPEPNATNTDQLGSDAR